MSEKIKILTYENIPCWYEISWREPSLILRINKEFIINNRLDLAKSPIVEHYKKESKLPDFDDDFTKDIGFGGIFKYLCEIDDFIEFEITIPKIKWITETKCGDCSGTGLEEHYDGKCLFCEGTGYKWIMEWKEITKISATFSVLTTWLHFCEIETSVSYPQLMTFETLTRQGMHGGSLNGDISIPFKAYLESLGDIYLHEISTATKSAHNQMFGYKEFYESSFNSYISKGRFIIDCPGNATGLHPSDWYDEKGKGFEFSCHNVDSPAQQLTLIVGLAVLCDMARRGWLR